MEDVRAGRKAIPTWVLDGQTIVTCVEAAFIELDFVGAVVTEDIGGIETAEGPGEIGGVWDSNVHGTIASTIGAVCAAGAAAATSGCRVATTPSTPAAATPSTGCCATAVATAVLLLDYWL
jgi:hypothetical protein